LLEFHTVFFIGAEEIVGFFIWRLYQLIEKLLVLRFNKLAQLIDLLYLCLFWLLDWLVFQDYRIHQALPLFLFESELHLLVQLFRLAQLLNGMVMLPIRDLRRNFTYKHLLISTTTPASASR
jgi:hypothetical protein